MQNILMDYCLYPFLNKNKIYSIRQNTLDNNAYLKLIDLCIADDEIVLWIENEWNSSFYL